MLSNWPFFAGFAELIDEVKQAKEKIKVFFQPLSREIQNRWSYFHYSIQRLPLESKVSGLIMIAGYIVAVLSFICSLGKLIQSYMGDFQGTWSKVFKLFSSMENSLAFQWLAMAAGIMFPILFALIRYVPRIDNKYLHEELIDESIYEQVDPPILENTEIKYKKIDIKIGNEPKETVYISDQIDQWLYSGSEITIERDFTYERDLRKNISKHFSSLYRPFLYHNYRESLFQGRQFTNEGKWGISEEMLPKRDEKTGEYEKYSVKIHKTSYFDTYLTNITPGRKLVSNRTGETMYVADGNCLPYNEKGKRKRLSKLRTKLTANEVGVSTLCIFKGEEDFIPLWTQNQQAQSSRGQTVASGSGSADWRDCKQALKKKSFRDAVVFGMKRELFEESFGERNIRKADFKKYTKTRIIGYFRWLQKGGKSEFVGLTKLDMEQGMGKLAPEQSEVTNGSCIPAESIYTLLQALNKLVYFDEENGLCESENCSVSCCVSILALRKICLQYCKKDCTGNYPKCPSCNKKPAFVLFEKEEKSPVE